MSARLPPSKQLHGHLLFAAFRFYYARRPRKGFPVVSCIPPSFPCSSLAGCMVLPWLPGQRSRATSPHSPLPLLFVVPHCPRLLRRPERRLVRCAGVRCVGVPAIVRASSPAAPAAPSLAGARRTAELSNERGRTTAEQRQTMTSSEDDDVIYGGRGGRPRAGPSTAARWADAGAS